MKNGKTLKFSPLRALAIHECFFFFSNLYDIWGLSKSLAIKILIHFQFTLSTDHYLGVTFRRFGTQDLWSRASVKTSECLRSCC